MKTNILYLFTRTPLHVGAGNSVGVVDQPIQRERHTGFPIIPGSSIKGVLRDFFGTPEKGDLVFGKLPEDPKNKEEKAFAGGVSFSEAKLLLFPIRSAKGCYALATSPLALARFKRDAKITLPVPSEPEIGTCLAGAPVTIGKDDKASTVLEEYTFKRVEDFPADWKEVLLSTFPGDPVLQSAADRLILLSEEDFSHFARNACQVHQHVAIDPKTGTKKDGALFNEETTPSETLFYAALTKVVRSPEQEKAVDEKLKSLHEEQLIQFGGNATTGLGLCSAILQSTKEA
ncbi:MAG: type III-B CRISPR module RAMP protein Cmr4 [Puniceicoccales bacterium]